MSAIKERKFSAPKYKIYDLLVDSADLTAEDRSKLPVDIDFKTGLSIDLHKEVIMQQGAPVSKTYYTEATLNQNGTISYSNPIIKIEYTFERDGISLAKSCTQHFRWYDTEGNLSEGYKEVKDFFNTVEKIAEAEQRRGNIISDLKVKTIGLLMYTEQLSQQDATALGRPFLADYKQHIYNYIDEANVGFATVVTNDTTYAWLDSITPYGITIRQYILNAIN